MNSIKVFEKILHVYKFEQPVPPTLKKKMFKTKRKTLITIIKNQKKYSVFTISIIVTFFWLKKLGITISLMKSALVFVVALVITTAVITTSVLITKSMVENNRDKTIPFNSDVLLNSVANNKTIKKSVNKSSNIVPGKNINENKVYKIGIEQFDNNTFDNELSKKISNLLKSEIDKKSRGFSTILVDRNVKRLPGLIMYGSIFKSNNKYLVTVKLLESLTLKIKFFTSEEFDSKEQIPGVCKKVAHRIIESIDD